EIFKVAGWNYPELLETYRFATEICRKEHVPVLVHVDELTQPTGHSTSGSHERYKSAERLAWEAEFDCNAQFRSWIIENGIATEEEIETIEIEAKEAVKTARNQAWTAYRASFKEDQETVNRLLKASLAEANRKEEIKVVVKQLSSVQFPIRRRSEEHTSELQSRENLVCRLLLEKKKKRLELRAHAAQTLL